MKKPNNAREPRFSPREAGYGRRATKRRGLWRRIEHPWRLLGILLAFVGVVAGALIWGSVLKEKSDVYRADREAGRWMLDAETAIPLPVAVPDLKALQIKPEGNTGDILIYGTHGGVILPLSTSDGELVYRSRVAEAAGLAVPAEAVSFPDDVARVSRRGLRVIGVFTVTSFGGDAAVSTYRRGLELALLREYAESGVDDLLLCGLPAGDEVADRAAYEYLCEVKSLLSELPDAPAVGVVLPLSAFAGVEVDEEGAPLYRGSDTPTRLRLACDFLAVDLRGMETETMLTTLERMQYAYVRHSLRLALNSQTDAAKIAEEHGFERIFEME